MGNEMFQARLNDDFAEEIHDYREDNYMNKSEAVRHLLRAGLEAETENEPDKVKTAIQEATAEEETKGNTTDAETMIERIAGKRTAYTGAGLYILSALSAYIAVAFPAVAVPAAVLGVLFMGVSVVIMALSFIAQVALLRPIGELVGLTTEAQHE